MKAGHAVRLILLLVVAFFVTLSNAFVSLAQTSQPIGYLGVNISGIGYPNSYSDQGYCTTDGPSQTPFYKSAQLGSQTQGNGNVCFDYVQLNTADTVQIVGPGCSLTLTGPGRFNATSYVGNSCVNSTPTPHAFWDYGVQVISFCSLSVSPATIVAGGAVSLTGNNFSTFNNTVQVTNTSDGTKSFSLTNQASPDGTSLIFTVPENTYPGSYTVSMPSNSSCAPVSLQIKSSSNAPSNLTATLDKTGKVTLNWINNAQGQTGIRIQNALDGNPKSFSTHVDIASPLTSYVDDLTQYPNSSTNPPFASSTELYRVAAKLADGTYSNFSNIASVKNCLLLSGNGPIKIVFMRTRGLANDYNDPDAVTAYTSQVQEMIRDGFSSIDPFKTYFDKLSFYIDLRAQDNILSDLMDSDEFKASSSCGGNAQNYILLYDSDYHLGAWSLVSNGTTVMNLSPDSLSGEKALNQGIVAVHEAGHSLGGLFDEYIVSGSNTYGNTTGMWGDLANNAANIKVSSTENCSSNPTWDYRSSLDNHVYGSVVNQGCTYLLSNPLPGAKHPTSYYRPSATSIMVPSGNTLAQNQFNVVSCGYIDAVLHGLPATKENAQIYWPECLAMAQKGSVIKDGLVPVSPTPAISKISDKTLAPDAAPATASISKLSSKAAPSNVTLTGTNFSTDPTNAVRLTNTISSNIYYEIPNLASPDGKTLTFSLPDNTPLGKYNLQVGAFNSDWSKAIQVSVLAAGTPPPKGSPAPSPSIPPLYDFGGMYGYGDVVNVNPATGALSCPSGYGSVLVNNGTAQGSSAHNIYICVRAHVDGQDPLYDFGGVYQNASYFGTQHYDNVATGYSTCPPGFTSARVMGGVVTSDGSIYFCYSPYSAGNRYYNFGGAYGTAANIVTAKKTCPAGYTAFTINGIFTYCYQPMYQPSSAPVLKATALSGSEIQLTWTIANTTGLNSYTVHDYLSGPVYDSNQDTILHPYKEGIANTATSYVLSGLNPKTRYCFSLKAIAFYDVKESNLGCATTLGASVAPTQTPSQQSLPDATPVNPAPQTTPPVPSTPAPQAPAVTSISGPTQLNVGDTAKWSATASDPQGSAMTYSIDWGDSTPSASSQVPSFKHTYASSGTYSIIFTAKNSLGLSGWKNLQVSVIAPVTSSASYTTVSVTPPAAPTVTASLIDASSDKAGIWNVFGPGPGRVNGNNPYDWHWSLSISNASGKTLKYATVIMNGIREGWSSSASTNNAFGVQLYPLVISTAGFLTTAADQTYPLTSNQIILDLYGQPEDPAGTAFRGATLTVGFTDGTTATAQIPSSSISIPAAPSSSTGTASALDGLSDWLQDIFGW